MSFSFETLLESYLAGTIDAEGMARLNAILKSNPSSRKRFAEVLNLDAALAAFARRVPHPEHLPAQARADRRSSLQRNRPPRSLRSSLARAALAMAACIAVALALARFFSVPAEFARVAPSAQVPELSPGTPLHSEVRHLHAGTLPLLTAKGVRLVLEAPATFRFESAQKLHLTRGRLTADVPPEGKGFTVVTPSGNAVDLGTRFGVDVPESGDTEVHVFQGLVIANSKHDRQRNLQTGEALAMTRGGNAARDLRPAAFIQHEEQNALSAGLAAGQQGRAREMLQHLRQDPALIALIDFTDPFLQGSFRSVQGRWPGSRAPEFMRQGDHVSIDVGGGKEWPQLTIAMWARLDRLGDPYQSLLHTDGWSANKPGQVHWMLISDTTMRFGLYGNKLAQQFIQNPPRSLLHGVPQSLTPLSPAQGRWVHLAAVYNADAKTVRFFVNGRLDNEMSLEVALPARLGPARIGNWDTSDRKLSGRIDEVLILGRCLADGEISNLHDSGTPYR
jgi:ferric-dicitrate binding protein FerR (iron transport regulator)